jgi:DNA helicase-2/ATP-dependent DNA helicase PcrA
MDLLADLTPSQRQAVLHIDGPLLVLAGAGSGKTRVITRRVAYLLRQGIAGKNILAITFTNKAAGEMRERIEALAPGAGVWVGTFHSLCARLLRTHAPLVGIDRGFTIYDQADRIRALKQVMNQHDLNGVAVSPERVESAISRAKNDLVGPEAPAWHDGDPVAAVAAQVYPYYQTRLRESSAVDFDDLLVHLVTILKEHPDVRAELDRRYKYVLVDEYQDTNLAQYAIVRALSVDYPNLCVTGDPDQSIYGWRGANLGNILEFERDFPGCKVVKLERNYRSTKNILRVADHLIRHNLRRKPKALTTENPSGAPVELVIYATEADEARGVAARIAEAVREHDAVYGDIAVFCRVTALTRNFESAFREASIPYQIVGGFSFYERQEVKDVLSYLNLMTNPKDDIAFARVVNTPPRGVGETSQEKLTERARELGVPLRTMARQAADVPGLKERARAGLRDFSFLMDELAELREYSAEEATRRLLDLTGYRKWLKDEAQTRGTSEDRVENVDELVSAARMFDLGHPGATVLDFMEELSLASAVDRWNDESGAVTLMTLHASKGLEFPLVFIVGLEEGLLPHARSGDKVPNLEEERRLLFVGITRARNELCLSRCRIREFRGQQKPTIRSQFLAELPEEAMNVRDVSGLASSGSFIAISRQDNRPTPAGRGFNLTTAAALAAGTVEFRPSDNLSVFAPGVQVMHPQYGLGRIVAIDGAGPDRKGRIAFAVGGERTFLLAVAPLRFVSGNR